MTFVLQVVAYLIKKFNPFKRGNGGLEFMLTFLIWFVCENLLTYSETPFYSQKDNYDHLV